MTSTPTVSVLEYHVLLSMATSPQYGYAIKEAVEVESDGTLTPPAGSLYRVIARMITRGWVIETEPEQAVAPHPGLSRRYYGLTAVGRSALAAQTRRLRDATDLAVSRLGATEGRP